MSGRVTSSGKNSRRLLEQIAAKLRLGGAESLRDAGQIPDRVDRDLDDGKTAVGMDGVAVRLQPPGRQRVAHLDQVESRARDCNRRADVEPLRDLLLELLRNQMPPRIERYDPLRLAPLRERADHGRGMRVGEIGPPDRIKHAGRNGERAIERVRAAVTAYHVAQARLRHRSDHRPALASRGGAPINRKAHLRLGVGMRGKPDMILPVR